MISDIAGEKMITEDDIKTLDDASWMLPILYRVGETDNNLLRLFHYTSNKAKEGIYQKKNKIRLFISSVEDFLDKNEGISIIEPYYSACGRLYEQNLIDEFFYETLRSVTPHDLRECYTSTKNLYVLSFSRNGCSEYMKEKYAPSNGWILSINYDRLEEIRNDYEKEGYMEILQVE